MARKDLINQEEIEEMTAEEKFKQAKREAAKRHREKFVEARTALREFAKTLDTTDADNAKLKELIDIVAGVEKQKGLPRVSAKKQMNEDIKTLLLDGQEHSEMEIFKTFHVGRPEMAGKIRLFIRNENVDERLWIHFDEEKESYRLMGQGKDAPDGWTGFLPAENVIL
jgi:hypothetical protein